MKKAVISVIDSSYSIYKRNDAKISILAHFLLYDVGFHELSISSFKKWIFDSEYDATCCNETCLEKSQNVITILYQNALELGVTEYCEFRASKKDLWNIIDRWEQLCKQRPKEIVISEHPDGKILLEANNDIVIDAIISFYGGKYNYPKSVDKGLYHLAFFLIHEFKMLGLSHSFILNEWVNDPKDGNIYENLLFLEKKDGLISIIRDPKNADKSFAFVTTKEKLRKIYRQFEKAKALRRDYIFIIRDGNEIKIKGVDSEV